MRTFDLMQNYLLKSDSSEEYNIWMLESNQDLSGDYLTLLSSGGEEVTVHKDKFWDKFKEDDSRL